MGRYNPIWSQITYPSDAVVDLEEVYQELEEAARMAYAEHAGVPLTWLNVERIDRKDESLDEWVPGYRRSVVKIWFGPIVKVLEEQNR